MMAVRLLAAGLTRSCYHRGMPIHPISPRRRLLALAALSISLLSACSPKHDWREVRAENGRYLIALPGKPATLSRSIDLDGLPLTMTMTASEIDGVTFAVGSAELPDAGQSGKALTAMQTALLRNIGGTLRSEKPFADGGPAGKEIEALGAPSQATGGQPRLLLARFTARDRRIYQLLVTGPEKSVSREAADTFFSSFKPN
jgi:hypothetical protein